MPTNATKTKATKTCAHCGAKPKPRRKPAARRKSAPRPARRTAKKESHEMTKQQLGWTIYVAAVWAIFIAAFFVPAAPPG